MRRLLLFSCALTALLAPAAAQAADGTFKTTVTGTVNESWRVDRSNMTDICERYMQGSGGATVSFSTPKPKKVSFGVDHGFHSRLPVEVTVQRHGTVTPIPEGQECSAERQAMDPLPTGASCGSRSYKTKIELDYPGTFHPSLDPTEAGGFGRDCPEADRLGIPDLFEGIDFDTNNVLALAGPTAKDLRLAIVTCRRRGCRHKRTNVIRFAKRIVAPYRGGVPGEYVADVAWQVKFVRVR